MIINTREHILTVKAQAGENSVTVFNGFVNLDDDRVICIAARPGMGKTALALQMALDYAQKIDKTVYIFSLELTTEQIYDRMLISLAEVDSYSFREKSFSEEEKKKIEAATCELKKMNLIIDDEPRLSVKQIEKKLEAVDDLGLVILDYFQLIEPDQKMEKREEERYEIGRQIKILSRARKVPIVYTSQLTRTLEHRKDKRPKLFDLCDSGVLEYDVDTACFLYREGYHGEYYDNNNTAEVIIPKNRPKDRHGNCGTVLLEWQGRFIKFREKDKEN